MTKTPVHRSLPCFVALLVAALLGLDTTRSLQADVIETVSGSIIRGNIVASDAGEIRVETDFAGLLKIKQTEVKAITTDGPIFVGLRGGNTISGRIEPNGDVLRVSGDAGALQVQPDAITALWRVGDKSPAEIQAESLLRRWTYELAFDLNGRGGNSDRLFLGLSGRAELKSPHDRLAFYGNYSQAEENNVKAQDEGKGGVDYTSFFSERVSWYVRTELGFDGTKDLDLRSQSAAGIGYSIIKNPTQTLEGRLGLSYRFEDYGLGEDFDSAGLDLGILHSLRRSWGQITNSISVTPAFDDLGNFVLVHESAVEIPLAGGTSTKPWRLRLGIKNDYTSEPPLGLKKHDWTYFSQFVFAWK